MDQRANQSDTAEETWKTLQVWPFLTKPHRQSSNGCGSPRCQTVHSALSCVCTAWAPPTHFQPQPSKNPSDEHTFPKSSTVRTSGTHIFCLELFFLFLFLHFPVVDGFHQHTGSATISSCKVYQLRIRFRRYDFLL